MINDEIYNKYNLVSVENRIRINMLKKISKILTFSEPKFLRSKFLYNSEMGKRDLRNADLLHIEKYVSIAAKSLFVLGSKDYNSFLNYVKKINERIPQINIVNKIILYVKNVMLCN